MIENSRDLFKATVAGEKTERPPIWLMRQAGRFLPEYRQLKQAHSFVEIVRTPDLAVEATLQPIRRFDFDCAIIFSDILVVAEALGFPYSFKDKGGIMLHKTVRSERDVAEMEARLDDVVGNLFYVGEALKILRSQLPNKAIYGFCGAPWTLACYLVEGENNVGFPKFATLYKEQKNLFERLMSVLTKASCRYAKMQARQGIDAFQIFDSHAALTSSGEYFSSSGKWIGEIEKSLSDEVASVVFANGMSSRLDEVVEIGADFYSLDASRKLSSVREKFDIGLQGNLPPEMLSEATPEQVAQKAKEIVCDMAGKGRHIFNLAHGIRPDAKLENVEAMCQAVRS